MIVKKQEWVTDIKCISAAGKTLSPIIIWKGQNFNPGWYQPIYLEISISESVRTAELQTTSAWNGYRECLNRKREKRRLVSRVYSLLMGMAVTYRLTSLLIIWKIALIYSLYLFITRSFYNLSILVSFPPLSVPTALKRTRFLGLIFSEFKKLDNFKYSCD